MASRAYLTTIVALGLVPTAISFDLTRLYIAGALSFVALQAFIVRGLRDRRAKVGGAEATVRTNDAALRLSHERIRQLAGRVITSQEAVRARIARDLHDDVCQELAAVSLTLSDLKRRGGLVQAQSAQETLALLQTRVLGLVEDIRRLSHDLHPGVLQHVGLVAALEAHCIQVERQWDVQVSLTADSELGDVPPDAALCLFRISQEALRNGARHGNARRLTVSLTRTPADFELTITDDGSGFDVAEVIQHTSGIGLVSMQERAYLVGGEVRVVSSLGSGTTIRARIPVNAGATEGANRKAADTLTDGTAASPSWSTRIQARLWQKSAPRSAR